AHASASVREQINSEGLVPNGHVFGLAGSFDDGPHDLMASRITQRVHDAAGGIGPPPPPNQPSLLHVKVRAPPPESREFGPALPAPPIPRWTDRTDQRQPLGCLQCDFRIDPPATSLRQCHLEHRRYYSVE